MANLSNINNKFLVTTGGNVLIGQTGAVGSSILQVTGNSTFAGDVLVEDNLYLTDAGTVRGKIQLNASDRDDLDIKVVSLGSNIKFFTVDTERMRIDSTGDLTMQGGRIYVKESDLGNTAIALTRDADEGYVQLFSSGTQTIEIRGNGNSYFNGGNVGIGETSPGAKFEVKGDSSSANLPIAKVISTGSISYLKFFNSSTGTGSSDGTYIGMNGGTSYFINKEAGNSYLGTGDAINLTLQNGGNVGIGTTSPGQKLVVTGNIGTSGSVLFDDNQGINFGNSNAKIYGSSSDGIKFNAGGSEGMRFNQSGNLGIGTTSPQSKLHIETGSGGTYSPNVNHDDVTIEGSGNIGLQLFSPATSYQYIAFGDPGSVNAGYLRYYHGTNEMVFRTNGSDNMVIDDDGNVGIGTTSPSYRLDINSSDSGLRIVGTTRSQILLSNGTSAWQIESPTSSGNVPAGALGIIESGVGSRLTILTGGNVGIGTTSPEEKLHVIGSTLISNNEFYKVEGTTGTNYKIAGLTNGNVIQIGAIDYTSAGTIFAGGNNISITTGGASGSTRMKIDSSGNVGIGTTSPASVLHIKDNSTGPTQLSIQSNDFTRAEEINFLNPSTSAISGQIKYYTNPTVEYMSFSTSNNSAAVERMRISNTLITVPTITELRADIAAKFAIGNMGGASSQMMVTSRGFLTFNVSNTGSGLDATERMRINSDGQVGIGIASSPSVRLLIKGHTTGTEKAIQANDSSNVDLFYVQNNGGGYLKASAWTYGSDRRLKENIIDVENGIEMVLKMKPKHFDYIDGTKNNLGFIAQDIEKIIPEAVSITNEQNKTLGLKTDFLVPYLVKAIQELEAKIKILENK